jgi:hypothetical protein
MSDDVLERQTGKMMADVKPVKLQSSEDVVRLYEFLSSMSTTNHS